MKAFQLLFLCIFLAGSVFILAGCGVSKEEHEKAVTDLSKFKAELEKTVTELTKIKADLSRARSQVAGLEKSLREVQAQIRGEPKGPVGPAASATQDNFAASQKQVEDLQVRVKSLSREMASLKW